MFRGWAACVRVRVCVGGWAGSGETTSTCLASLSAATNGMLLSHSFYGHKELRQEVSVTFIIVLPP